MKRRARPKAISSNFPLIDQSQADGFHYWTVPMSGANTQLQYGQFRDLNLDSLRPARDELGPILDFTEDGLIRGQVRIRDTWRHIDVRSRMTTQSPRLAFGQQLKWLGDSPPGMAPASPGGEYVVVGVRATRIKALYIEPLIPWMAEPARGEDRVTRAERADMAWDWITEQLRPRPIRYQARYNPNVWIFRLQHVEGEGP